MSTTADQTLRRGIEAIAARYAPSLHPFFRALAEGRRDVIAEPGRLGDLLHRYQAGMHATRAMAYCLPMLDSPELRKRKLRILVDDDGLVGGDTHHYQLTRAFMGMGALPRMKDEDYGDLETLQTRVDPKTAAFIAAVKRFYTRSLGAWALVEIMSDDWMHALASALSVHFPEVVEEPYFADCFEGHVEERHGQEALDLVVLVCASQPGHANLILADAEAMAGELNRLWDALHETIMPS